MVWDPPKPPVARNRARPAVAHSSPRGRGAAYPRRASRGLNEDSPEMSGINDFVVKFATVNGSGSASANGIFAKTLFRMGIPVSPKNIFPSNIQGLPTWYEVRVSEAGYLARRDGIDLMIAMNPQSYQEDLGELLPGGWLLYDSTLPRVWPRDDIKVLGIPLAEMCARKWSDPRQRQLFKNMAYVGALTALLDIDVDVLRATISDQLKGKEKLVAANMDAVMLGREYALDQFSCPLPIRVRPAQSARGKIIIRHTDSPRFSAVDRESAEARIFSIDSPLARYTLISRSADTWNRQKGDHGDCTVRLPSQDARRGAARILRPAGDRPAHRVRLERAGGRAVEAASRRHREDVPRSA